MNFVFEEGDEVRLSSRDNENKGTIVSCEGKNSFGLDMYSVRLKHGEIVKRVYYLLRHVDKEKANRIPAWIANSSEYFDESHQ